ncbi:MAG: formate dehydrogenase accessory sulfurtransferase FdhD [Chloroflexia bacterium]
MVRVVGNLRSTIYDEIAVEEPLQVRLAGEDVAVLMRSPGHDIELVAGYLFSEGVIHSRDDIEDIRTCASDTELPSNIVNVLLKDRTLLQPSSWSRFSEGYSSCGICGKTTIAQVMRHVPNLEETTQVAEAALYRLAQQIEEAQATFRRTGGLHAAALFSTEGEMLTLREDVGRHNAVDKIIGHALLNGDLPLRSCTMAVTSRASFEVVQKAANAGVSILAVMSAPSSLAVQLAQETGMTLVAFLRAGRFNIYSGSQRIVSGVDNIEAKR